MTDETLAKRVKERGENLANIETAIVQTDEATGFRSIVVTDDLRKSFNVLAPSSVFAQQNPQIQPQVSIIALEPAVDYYEIDKAKPQRGNWPATEANLAPRKEALGKLADARGISFPAELNKGVWGQREEFTVQHGTLSRTLRFRTYTFHAVGVVRGPDGAPIEYPAEVDFDPEVAALGAELEITRRVAKYNTPPTEAEVFGMILERFMQLAAYCAPMVKSKAQNAVIRSIIHIPQKLPASQAAKPFLFISYTYHNDSDAGQAALMQSVFGVSSAADAVYGPQPPALEPAPVVDQVDEDADVPDDILEGEYEVIEDGRTVDIATGEVVEGPQGFTPPPQPSQYDDVPPRTGAGLSEDERGSYGALLRYVLPATNQRGKTIAQVLESEGIAWFDQATAYFEAHRVEFGDLEREMFLQIVEFTALAHKVGV